MPRDWKQTRETFRHGDLPEALVEAALTRLEAAGVDALSLRELARDVGVNHRAVYRHFPDKLALLARVAEEGWRRLGGRMARATVGHATGEETLVAGGVAFFLFARDNPNLFQLMAGPRLNVEGRFAALDEAIMEALQVFEQGFLAHGTDRALVRKRTVIFAAALQGVTTQVLHRRFQLAPRRARAEIADICRMLVSGLR